MGRKKKKPELVIRPWSLGTCPTPLEIRDAWAKRDCALQNFIWLLSVLGELTCFTDCNLEHLGGFGNIAGRRGGLKEFLAREVPDLAPKYKSISRYATLATRLKIAFNYYPPAPISLIHPDLPILNFNVRFITNYAHQLYENHFKKLEPTYTSFAAMINRQLKANKKHYRWGPALPREEWPAAKEAWFKRYVKTKMVQQIHQDYTFYSGAYRPQAK